VDERRLVDTDVLLFLLRGDSRADRYRPHLAGRRLAISFQTLAELHAWALRRNWGPRRRQELSDFLQRLTIYYADAALCRAWAEIRVRVERQGHPVAPADLWVAAPAWLEQIPLVTHNRSDFEAIEGLVIVSEAP
jgi:tRNA(fMet)-specific endonuclease VapC